MTMDEGLTTLILLGVRFCPEFRALAFGDLWYYSYDNCWINGFDLHAISAASRDPRLGDLITTRWYEKGCLLP